MRSDERSKFGILEAMISTIVFSLKPALTSLITSAFVIGPSSLVCACTAKAEPAKRSKVIRNVGKKDFIAHPLSVAVPARPFVHRAAGPSVHSVYQSFSRNRASLGRGGRCDHT